MIKNNIIKHTDHLQAEIRENIGLIAFNRPESKNALSDELTPALRTTLENFESDKNVRVIVITGNGGAFCSGGDVKSFANNSDPGLSDDLSVEQKVRKLQITIRRNIPEIGFNQPVIRLAPARFGKRE